MAQPTPSVHVSPTGLVKRCEFNNGTCTKQVCNDIKTCVAMGLEAAYRKLKEKKKRRSDGRVPGAI